MAQTKNLGLVKAIFRQTTTPTRTDILWYDTLNEVMKIYNHTSLKWVPLRLQLTGNVTDDTPTSTEIDDIVGMNAVTAGAGYRCTIQDTSGGGVGDLYIVESNGTDWHYIKMTKAV